MQTFLNDPKNRIDDAQAFIANGQFHAWNTFLNAAGTPKIAIGFQSGKARVTSPGMDITGRENQYFWAIISRGRGGAQDRAANIVDGVGGGKPLIESAEILRDAMRAFRFDPVTDEQTDYVGIEEWGLKEGFNMDGYKVTIWVGTQMPNDAPLPIDVEPI